MLEELALRGAQKMPPDPLLRSAAGEPFYNARALNLSKLIGDQHNIDLNLRDHVLAFSPEVRNIFDHFDFDTWIERLNRSRAALSGHREIRAH